MLGNEEKRENSAPQTNLLSCYL